MFSNRFRISMLILVVWALSSLWAVAAYSQSFDACISSYMAGGSGWCKVSDDVFDNARLTDAEANAIGVRGNGGSRAVMTAWNGAALDPDRLILYFFGGGHNDYYGNEWYAYHIKTGRFERLTDPSPLTHYYFSTTLNQYCRVPDPAFPSSAHTYDGLGFNTSTGTIIMVNQGYSQNCSAIRPAGTQINPQPSIYEFNPSRTETRNGIPPLGHKRHGGHNFQYPRSVIKGGIIMLGSNLQLWRYSFVNGVLTQQDYTFRNAPAGDGVADKLVGTSERVTYMNAGFMWGFWRSELGWPEYITRTRIPNDGGMACGIGECLFWSGERNVTLWTHATRSWREIVHTNGPTGGNPRVYSKIQYLEDYNVYVGVSDADQPVYLYKVAGSTTISPEPIPAPDPDPDPTPEPDPIPEPTPEPEPEPEPEPTPDPGPEPIDFSDWMVEPDWATFAPNVVFSGPQTYSVTSGDTVFIFVIEKDLQRGVYVLRAIDRSPLVDGSALIDAITQ